MGLLYGGGDPDATIAISTRCGQDSDCNPSNAAGVLFTSMGYANLPDKFTSGLVRDREFLHTAYSFHELTAVCQDLARQAVLRSGGRIETGADGGDVFVIPVREVEPPPLEQCSAPGPIANSVYTEEELATLTIGKATAEGYVDLSGALEEFAPGWAGRHCGWDMSPGLYPAYRGREGVLLTHPGGRETACALTRTVEVPQPGATLRFAVSHHPDGDWLLAVKANGDVVLEQPVGPETVQNGWLEVELDLSPYAGRAVELELLNQPTGWMCEAGYWDCLEVVAAE
jgi:hypothetical protein